MASLRVGAESQWSIPNGAEVGSTQRGPGMCANCSLRVSEFIWGRGQQGQIPPSNTQGEQEN